MTHPSSTVDLKALNTVAALWLEQITGASADYPDLPSSLVHQLVDIDENLLPSAYAFELGFDLAMGVAAAVVADPLGDPTTSLKAAIEKARVDIEHAQEEATKEIANTCAACGRPK